MMTLRPGILVSVHVPVKGGRSYLVNELESERDGGRLRAKWETTKIVEDVQDFERASKAASKAGSLIRRMCIKTAFGYICPADREKSLDGAIEEAKRIADQHNTDATTTNVRVYVMRGRIAESDSEAAAAIAEEVRELLNAMETGIRAVDVKAIRDAADRAKAIGATLDRASAERVTSAVKAARAAAREIVKRVEKGGEDAAIVINELNTRPIESARFAFLDLEETTIDTDSTPAIELNRFDLETVEAEPMDFKPEMVASPSMSVEIEL